MSIADNLAEVRRAICEAARLADREPAEIELLAVSKTMPSETILEAYQAGQRVFAENRIQEWLSKVDQLPEDIKWHIIGSIQTNKVKYLDERVEMIHSLDRMDLLAELEKQGSKKGIVWSTLIQVNVAQDPAKAGLEVDEVPEFLATIPKYPHVRVMGLMTIGRLGATSEETRGYFRELVRLRDIWQKEAPKEVLLRELSMGMSQDYVEAIREGSTMIRVGRQIFGGRN